MDRVGGVKGHTRGSQFENTGTISVMNAGSDPTPSPLTTIPRPVHPTLKILISSTHLRRNTLII
eukprot:754502-Hanusia_phi.AAC.1